MRRNMLPLIALIVFVDLLGFSVILPLLPYYAESFGANAAVAGLLVASYAAAQLVGAPILGRLSDRLGRRPILLVSILGTCIGFLILGAAWALWVLFAARIVDGLTGGNISVAQAYISDVTDEKSRAKGLGLIGAAFGLGFIIGPAVGGLLSRWGYAVPAYVAAGLSAINLAAVFFLLPESLTPERRAELRNSPTARFDLRLLGEALRKPLVGPLLNVRFFSGLAAGMFETGFSLYARYRFGLAAQATGYILAYVGVLVVLVQGVAIGALTARFRERQLVVGGLAILAVGLVAWAWAPSLPALLVVLAPLSLAIGLLNTVVNSGLTKSICPEQVGGILGLSTALESATRVIAPSLAGFLIGSLSTAAPGLVAAAITCAVLAPTARPLLTLNPTGTADRECF